MKRLLFPSLNYSLLHPPSLHLGRHRRAKAGAAVRPRPSDHDEWVRERPEIVGEGRVVEEENNIIRNIKVISYLNFIGKKTHKVFPIGKKTIEVFKL